MRFLPAFTAVVLLSTAVPGFALKTTHHSASTHAIIRHTAVKKGSHSALRHEIGMDSERATQIQQALIKQGYMSGEPSGVWDSQTTTAMQKLQSDNGWQTRLIPDSRALIKLGLGPQQPAQSASLAPAQ
jgi:peptidoglycan hydrolase-like protein with peptidoglycan-binding domain